MSDLMGTLTHIQTVARGSALTLWDGENVHVALGADFPDVGRFVLDGGPTVYSYGTVARGEDGSAVLVLPDAVGPDGATEGGVVLLGDDGAPVVDVWAMVETAGVDDATQCLVPHDLRAVLTDGARDQPVKIGTVDGVWTLLEIHGRKAEVQVEGLSEGVWTAISANGGNHVTHSIAVPDTDGVVVGDAWFRHDTTLSAPVIGQWTWSGSAWVSVAMSHQVIASVDLGTATVGSLTGRTVQTESDADRGVKMTSAGLFAWDSGGNLTTEITGGGTGNRFRTVDSVSGKTSSVEGGAVYLSTGAASGGNISAATDGMSYGASRGVGVVGTHLFHGQGVSIHAPGFINDGVEMRQTGLAALTVMGSLAATGNLEALNFRDTGWRNISSLFNGGSAWGGSVQIRRVGDMVHMTGYATVTSGSPFIGLSREGTALITVPDNFRPVYRAYDHGLGSALYSGGAAHVGYQASASRIALRGATGVWAEAQNIGFTLTWMTNQGWPGTLPGVPA